MPVELLIHSFGHNKALKGTIQDARNVSDLPIRPWGRKEGLPNYVKVRITDAAKTDVEQYLMPVKNKFSFTLIEDTGTSLIFDITVNKKMLALFGNTKGITLDAILALDEKGHDVTFVNRELDNSRLRLNIKDTDGRQMMDDVLDMFQEVVATRRYHIDPAVVDLAIANGGVLERTSVQVIPGVVDRIG